MKTNIMIDISLPHIWQILVLHLWAKMLKDSLKCNILRKKCAQQDMPKVPKITSFQYLWKIARKT